MSSIVTPAAPDHYAVLGIARDASTIEIRTAYRDRARQHHPDRSGRESSRMAAINEAYRVLGDPGRRAMYDRSLTGPSDLARGPGSADGSEPSDEAPDDAEPIASADRATFLSPDGPARVPWRLMVVLAAAGSGLVVATAALNGGSGPQPPDGIVRPGDCVTYESNGDAREVACTGEGDHVVEVLVPLDAVCPADTEPHRDRLGLGIACVAG